MIFDVNAELVVYNYVFMIPRINCHKLIYLITEIRILKYIIHVYFDGLSIHTLLDKKFGPPKFCLD